MGASRRETADLAAVGMHPSFGVRDARVDDGAPRGYAPQELLHPSLVAETVGSQDLCGWLGQMPCRGCRGRQRKAASAGLPWEG
eukprot:3959481-Heterocapsa_arctica.AAC.1